MDLKRYFKQRKLHVRLTFIGGLTVMTNRANDDLKENFKFCLVRVRVRVRVRVSRLGLGLGLGLGFRVRVRV